MKIKTSELTGPALDWAVAKCEGGAVDDPNWDNKYLDAYLFSTDWAAGGPIIEREGMHLDCLREADHYRTAVWEAWPYKGGTKHIQQGSTPLVAAMRCYVASKLGDEVEVPEELV